MNAEKLFDEIGLINDKFITEANTDTLNSKNKYIYIFNKPIKRMTVIAACILIIFAATFSIGAIRTSIINISIEIYEKFSAVFFVTNDGSELNAPTEIEILYSPTHIPDGYILEEEISNPAIRVLIYSNANGNEISFKQNILTSGIIINTEGIETEDIFIHGIKGIFYSNKGLNNILWHDNQYNYMVSGIIDKSVLQKMAESIKAEK